MPRIDFERMPDDARLWIFGASEPLGDAARARVLEETDRFLEGWAAHGTPLTGARALVDDAFLLVAVDQASVPPSGCSIDAMVRVLKSLETELGVELVSHGDVHLRGERGVERVSRSEFKAGVAEGRWDVDTPVFDTTLTSVGAWRDEGRFEHPARHGWHGLAFFRNAPASS